MSKKYRFTPSNTGVLHIGSLRTALTSYILSKQDKGSFILRMEDTDKTRSTDEYSKNILDSLQWAGIKHNGKILSQDLNYTSGVYESIIKNLVDSGTAYYCTCSMATLKAMKSQQIRSKSRIGYNGHCRDAGHKSGVLRLNIAKIRTLLDDEDEYGGKRFIKFKDGVYGSRNTDLRDLNDAVLARSTGMPTYLLANTADDLISNVSNIVRGCDLLPQTVIQMVLRKSIAMTSGHSIDIPAYTHLPLVLGEKGEKLSKRNPSTTSILQYKEKGIMPDALNQFILAIGNNSIPRDKALSLTRLTSTYDVSKNATSNVKYSEHLLYFINKLHIRKTTNKTLNKLLSTSFANNVLNTSKIRVNNLVDLKEECIQITDILSNYTKELKALKDTSAASCKEFREKYLKNIKGISVVELKGLV